MKRNLEKYISHVENNDVISFDIFDTLVLRDIYQPVDIFRVLEKEVKEKYKIDNFFNLRVTKESESRTRAENTETTIEMIYEDIAKEIGVENAAKIMQREFELECEFIKPNPFMKKVFEKAQELNKKVLLITDMYLTRVEIEKLLEITGYSKFEYTLYISSECKKSKHLKDIYPYVKEKENIEYEKWAHFGDNLFSDVENAKFYNINAMHYPKVADVSNYGVNNSIEMSIIKAIQANEIYNGLDDYDYFYKLGSELISPLMFAISFWLSKHLKNEDNIYFLSRDGRLPYEVFNIINEQMENDIESKYIYTSRKAYQIPASFVFDDKSAMATTLTDANIKFGDERTMGEILELAKLNPEDYKDKLKLFGFDDLDKGITINEIHNAKKFLMNVSLDIKKIFKKEIDIINKYLEQEGMLEKEKVNIFDIGWRGSIQRAIKQITEQDIYGYYFATNHIVYPELIPETFGYVYDLGAPHDLFLEVDKHLMMYELFFSSPEKSLNGFKEENGKIVPIFVENDEDHVNEISKFLDSVIFFANKYVEYLKYFDNMDAREFVGRINNFLNDLNYDDLVQFKKFQTNLSYSDLTTPYVKEYDAEYIKKNKEEFYKDISLSLWKNAFLVKGIETKEEYYAFKKKYLADFDQRIVKRKLFTASNFKKGIKDPKKVIKKVINKI